MQVGSRGAQRTVNDSETAAEEQPLDQRYGGDRSSTSRIAWRIAVGALAVAFLAWVTWAALGSASPGGGAVLRSYDVVSAHKVRVQLDVPRPAHRPLVCMVTAQADDHSVVGQTQVRVPLGPQGDIVVTTTVKTDREAATAVLSSCR
jgi:uncharacterized protein DUF4307